MIGKLLRAMIGTGCAHEWEIVRQGHSGIGVFGGGYTWYDCRCKKCGHMKCFKL